MMPYSRIDGMEQEVQLLDTVSDYWKVTNVREEYRETDIIRYVGRTEFWINNMPGNTALLVLHVDMLSSLLKEQNNPDLTLWTTVVYKNLRYKY
jgi:hypothetical protein